MKDSDPRPAPPVPPRRLKRKNKSLVGPTDGVTEAGTNSVIRLEPRPRLPPPPPPQRSIPRRGIRPQMLPPSEVAEIISPASYSAENCHSDSIIGDKSIMSNIEDVQPTLSTFGTTVRLPLARGSGKKPSAEEPQRRKREKAKVSRPNEYPPLFFTLQDFQEVMSDVETSYSRTLKNMTTFEPTPKPRVSKISINSLPETPEKGEVLFRVTTTNLPFEKSPSEWSDGGNDPNHFIFEDYVDRRQISAQRKLKTSSTKLVLFGDDTFDRDDEDQTISTSHTASRVRFLVDFPSKDENYDKITELDSLQNIDSLPLDCPPSNDLMLEKTPRSDEDEEEYEGQHEDEFGDVPFDSLLNATNDSTPSLGVDPSEDSTSSKTDFQTILVTAMVEPLPSVEGIKKPSENSDIELLGEKDELFLEKKVISKDEDDCDDPKSSCLKAETLELDVKCETQKSDTAEFPDERNERMETIDQMEERKKVMVDETFPDFMEFENYADKSPTENVRRNSFLMNMLQGDELDERVVCKVVAAHPKTPIHGSGINGVREIGEPSAAIEAKSKLLGELSSSFSAIKLKPVNNVEEVDEKQSASDLKFDSMNAGEEGVKIVTEVENPDDKNDDDDYEYDGDYKEEDDEAENDKKYKLNRNIDSVLDNNVVKCKVNEEPIEDESSKSRNEPQDRSNVCSQKTDEINDKNYVENKNIVCEKSEIEIVEDNDNKNIKIDWNNVKGICNNKNDDDNDGNNHSIKNIKKNINNNVVEVASRSSVDKCAIVLKCNNNNDNNAMTPVDVSYDQSQNNVSIIPGSVRSFVKFYEIQGETSVSLNSNDIAAVPKIKVEATGNLLDNLTKISNISVNKNPINMEIENDIKYTIVARKPAIKKQHNTIPADQKHLVNHRKDKFDKSTRPVLAKTEATPESRSISVKLFKTDGKGDVQSHTGSSLIRSTQIVQNEQEEAATELRREPRSKLSASKKLDAVVSSTHNPASGIAHGIQDGTTTGVIKDVVRSGTTNHLVPKSSASTINEQYTFYCTV